MGPGKFITFEGGEGAGKTTLIKSIAAYLQGQSQDVLTTREPGSGDLGRAIREILLEGLAMPPKSELFLFLADRANHVETIIKPALALGKTVLCDRYTDSTFVYQAIARGLDADFVVKGNHFAIGGLIPDLTILLDIDPQLGLKRVSGKNRLDEESLEFHQKVRQGFLDLANKEKGRIKLIDASLPAEEVLKLTCSLLSA